MREALFGGASGASSLFDEIACHTVDNNYERDNISVTESDSVTCIKSDKGFPCRKRHLPGTAHTTSYGSECSEFSTLHAL